jgi:hypothetical protein
MRTCLMLHFMCVFINQNDKEKMLMLSKRRHHFLENFYCKFVYCRPSVPNCKSFDFFYLKFERSYYSKKLCKHSKILVILEELLLIKNKTTKKYSAQIFIKTKDESSNLG